ncbi:uncharacterized protein LOC110835627 isoform X2 [Zootermopsis nevadensis]|uniref:uncharacterized protein LOC110835627 isoform X2 n=1 Tax=Zootermopsis nevadensis TaxID=136037 RepID=UPI000B8E8C59|nr:uncharacterized protein LOC110835627 isoform X2 [Zootermopsis nevadensis]
MFHLQKATELFVEILVNMKHLSPAAKTHGQALLCRKIIADWERRLISLSAFIQKYETISVGSFQATFHYNTPIMMCDEQFSYPKEIMQSLATRVPKIILHRAEEIFTSLNGTLKIDKIEVENDVDVLSEEDSVGLRNDEVYTPSTFAIIKEEWKNPMDLVEDEPHSDSDTCQDGNEVISVKAEDISDIKIEEHHVLIPFPDINDEQGVSP